MAFAESGSEGEDVRGGGARIQAADIRFLNNRAIGHWVGERHAELDNICATRDERVEIGRSVAVTSGDEGDEGWVRFGEGGGEAGHFAFNPQNHLLQVNAVTNKSTVKKSSAPKIGTSPLKKLNAEKIITPIKTSHRYPRRKAFIS
jgi:hypothetical protein